MSLFTSISVLRNRFIIGVNRGEAKLSVIALLAGAVLISACSKPPEPAPEPSPTPTPAAAIATPAPRLAPAGVYYLITRLSVTTDSGIIGLAPGTELKLIDKAAEGIRLRTRTGEEVNVREDQVTNDLDVAGHIAANDAYAQQLGAQIRAREEAMLEGQKAAAAATPAPAPPSHTTVIYQRQPDKTYNERQREKGLNGGPYDEKFSPIYPVYDRYGVRIR